MPRPMQGIGDINSGGGFLLTGYPKCINTIISAYSTRIPFCFLFCKRVPSG